MERKEGRIGEPQEYVEFDLGKKSIIAQASGEDWVVYLNYHGKKAPVRTLAYFSHKQRMIGAHSVTTVALYTSQTTRPTTFCVLTGHATSSPLAEGVRDSRKKRLAIAMMTSWWRFQK